MIEINGTKYIERQAEKPNSRLGGKMGLLLGMAAMFGGMMGDMMGDIKEPERPDVNIVEEYKLIQQKKSQLSRSQRDWVEYTFNKHFKEYTKEDEKRDKEMAEKLKELREKHKHQLKSK